MKKFLPHQPLLTFYKSDKKRIAQKTCGKVVLFCIWIIHTFENDFEKLSAISFCKDAQVFRRTKWNYSK